MEPFLEEENRTRAQLMDSSDYVVTVNETDLENEIPENQDPVTMMSILVVGTFLTLLIFLSVAGNILVCVAIYTDRGLRRIGNLFLASLAIADLFVASLVMTFAGVNDILGYWIFGAQFCDTYGRWVTRRVALGTIATIWLLAALISFVPISLGLHRPPQPLVYNAGGQNYPTCALDLTPTYAVVSSCISFYVPCIVMIGIYCRLYCYAQKHVKNIRAITRPIDLPENSNTKKSMKQKNKALHIHLHNHHSSPYHVSDHKAAVTVGIIMGVFLICWVPFFCINIVAAFCKTCIPDITFKILTWLGYSNSAFNPIIYSIFNTEFREAFKRILTAHYPAWCKCGYQSVSLNTNDKFVTDYGTKTVIVNARRNGSFGEFSSEHLSTESVHQTRVNSTERDLFGEGVSAI
ncbi:dopamine receptor 1 isoform X2 [Tribolium castaneum]|uniref:dopamine receptor 1 isoform X2 n=1 Tax=Tribolium castaneum TaxID=7070 RepID=UPI00077DB219|nr:PREDICTED: dopamine receptor 1 isoform X2 [Tribolium castaneum]|eukprot:XP_015838636.1 PREDICTED: dopamine receptor 1 isoform X2 [Tribolium castaneum]